MMAFNTITVDLVVKVTSANIINKNQDTYAKKKVSNI